MPIIIKHIDINPTELLKKIRQKEILFAGNKLLKIYGTLHCRSGKRMKKENRVFFSSAKGAIKNNYRPCGHCMKGAYAKWKKNN